MACHAEMMTAKYALAHLNELVAPPMVEVSARLKENIKTTDEEENEKQAVAEWLYDRYEDTKF